MWSRFIHFQCRSSLRAQVLFSKNWHSVNCVVKTFVQLLSFDLLTFHTEPCHAIYHTCYLIAIQRLTLVKSITKLRWTRTRSIRRKCPIIWHIYPRRGPSWCIMQHYLSLFDFRLHVCQGLFCLSPILRSKSATALSTTGPLGPDDSCPNATCGFTRFVRDGVVAFSWHTDVRQDRPVPV
jgi:hypothetical protein